MIKVVRPLYVTRVKKGCGQRKNKRDRAGRRRHAIIVAFLQKHPESSTDTALALAS